MQITIGRGNNRVTTEILTGRTTTKADRIKIERDAEHLKAYLFRPKLLSK